MKWLHKTKAVPSCALSLLQCVQSYVIPWDTVEFMICYKIEGYYIRFSPNSGSYTSLKKSTVEITEKVKYSENNTVEMLTIWDIIWTTCYLTKSGLPTGHEVCSNRAALLICKINWNSVRKKINSLKVFDNIMRQIQKHS